MLAVGEEKHITVVFRSETACTHKFRMSLQISDTEGLRKWENTEDITVNAEAFAVDVVPSFPNDAQGLDFGDVRVGAVVEQTFQVANNGKYAVSFDLKVRRKVIKEILQIDYGVVLEAAWPAPFPQFSGSGVAWRSMAKHGVAGRSTA